MALVEPTRVVGETPVERLLTLARDGDVARLGGYAVVDREGHHRPVYRGLLVYCALLAFGVAYETLSAGEFGRWVEGLRPWADLMEAELGRIEWPGEVGDEIPGLLGGAAADAAWMSLALHVAGRVFVRDAWGDLASETFGRLVRCQRENGAFLAASGADNPETLWYHELVLLHAAASYAVQAEDRAAAAAVARNAVYHQNETQPDHASTQPWGLFAFVWNPETRMQADQLLHAATTIGGGAGVSGVTSLLLGDALYCLRLFEG